MNLILVTGANGLVGQVLTKTLRERGHDVLATGRGQARSPGRYSEMDFTDATQVRRLFEALHPSVVVHSGAMTQVDPCELNPAECRHVNVSGTKNLLEAARSHGATFVFLSTDFIFDGRSGPYAEDDAPNPLNVYGRSKLDAETTVKTSGLSWTIVRTVLVYGNPVTGTRSNLITWTRDNLAAGKSIKVVSDQWRTPTYVEDLALGIALAIEKEARGVYHISGRDFLTPYEMAMDTAEALGLDKSLIERVDASTFTQAGKRPPRTGFVIGKAMRELGFAPISFEEGILRTVG